MRLRFGGDHRDAGERGQPSLRLLRAHRIVSVHRRGRMAYYRLDDAHVRMLLDLGLTHTQHTEAIHPERTEQPR